MIKMLGLSFSQESGKGVFVSALPIHLRNNTKKFNKCKPATLEKMPFLW